MGLLSLRPLAVALAVTIAAAIGALLVAGCGARGDSRGGSRGKNATLVLDFTPNAVHAGIYSALARGYDRDQGVRLHVVAPSASTDSIKLLRTGRANFAILDIHDLAIARQRGEDIVGLMSIVERPLAALIAAPAIRSPRDLAGKVVGVTGVPSDNAVLHSIVAGAGGDPRAVKTVTIGFNAVASLLSARIAAATSFWNDEGVTLTRRRPGFHVFHVESFGGPDYPELVLCAAGASLHADPSLARGVVRALVRGYGVTLSDPRASAADLERLVPGLDPSLVSAELRALSGSSRAPDGKVGELDLRELQAWAPWEAREGIVSRQPDVSAMFDPGFVAGAGPAARSGAGGY
ncbi:MAG: ABC transporter substrate-binding protein [Actinomycetota bacterium]|nr:ABC transporter substrate-binding protein [Actinomycetota bacterium]